MTPMRKTPRSLHSEFRRVPIQGIIEESLHSAYISTGQMMNRSTSIPIGLAFSADHPLAPDDTNNLLSSDIPTQYWIIMVPIPKR
jgi:hypothetical protein